MKRKNKKILILLIISQLTVFCFAQEENEDYIRWMKEYEKAKAKLDTYEAVRAAGVASCLVSFALYMTNKEEVTERDFYGFAVTEKKPKTIYLISGAIGAGISLVGFALAGPAKGEVKALEMEGIKKGYITASIYPIEKGIAFSLKYSF